MRFALEHAIYDVASRHSACAFDTEGIAHFRAAQIRFLDDRFEQALHGLLNLIRNFINDIMRANVDVFLLRQFSGLAVRPHSKRNDDCPGSGGQQNVVLGDGAHA